MRKLLMIIMMVCGTGLYAQAQVIKPGVGFNFTDINTDNGESSARAGWQIGGSISFGQKIYFEPGLFYVGKSSEVTVREDFATDEINAKFKGFRIPVAVGVNVLGNGDSTFSLRAFGGGSAFLLTKVGDDQVKDDFKNTTYGVFAGAGLDISIIFVDLAYEWSISDLSDADNIDVGKSRGLYATAGLRFRL